MTTNKYYSAEMANKISKSITDYKYLTEGTGRTHGSYVMTHWKSLVGHVNSDMNMERYFAELNKQFGKKQYYSGMSVGIIIGSVITFSVVAAASTIYINRKDKNSSSNVFDNILFESRDHAEDARKQLLDWVDTYGFVSVGDLYEMCDVAVSDAIYKYGWTNLRNVKTIRVSNGYIIDLPKPKKIS